VAKDCPVERVVPIIESLRRMGESEARIAEVLKIPLRRLRGWAKENARVAEALEESPELANARVMRALFDLATGFTYTEKREGLSPRGKRTWTEKETRVPPNVMAAQLWLAARDPSRWGKEQARTEREVHLVIVDAARKGELPIQVYDGSAKALPEPKKKGQASLKSAKPSQEPPETPAEAPGEEEEAVQVEIGP